MSRFHRAILVYSVSILGLAALMPDVALAQAAAPAYPVYDPPLFRTVDANGVDLASGEYTGAAHSLTVGIPGKGGMTWRAQFIGVIPNLASHPAVRCNCYISDTYQAYMVNGPTPIPGAPNTASVTVRIGGRSSQFFGSTGYKSFTPYFGPNSDTLVYDSSRGGYVFTEKDGTYVLFPGASFPAGNLCPSDCYIKTASKLVKPDGEIWTYNYDSTGAFLTSVTNNYGYMIKYNYASSTGGLVAVVGVNTSVEYCNPNAMSSTFQNSWPTVSFSYPTTGTVVVTDSTGGTTTYSTSKHGNGNLVGTTIAYSDGRTINLTWDTQYTNTQGSGTSCISGVQQGAGGVLFYPYCPAQHVLTYNDGTATWGYAYQYVMRQGTNNYWYDLIATATDPLGHKRVVESEPSGQVITSTDELNRTTTIDAVPPGNSNLGLINSITKPDGDKISYTYGPLYSIATETHTPKPGSNLSPTVTTWTYGNGCTNVVLCALPTAVTDPNNNTTNFTYNSTTGQILTITSAAVNGVSAQIRYTYTPFTAQTKNASGSLVAEPSSVSLLTLASVCKTQASCSGSSDEIKTATNYTGPNLTPTSATTSGGDGSFSTTVSTSFDNIGNPIVIDGPRTDVDDRIYVTYDAERRKIYEIGADPDGSGPRKRVIVHHVYDSNGLEIRTETGTGNNTDGSDFVVTSFKRMTYDPAGRLIKTETVAP